MWKWLCSFVIVASAILSVAYEQHYAREKYRAQALTDCIALAISVEEQHTCAKESQSHKDYASWWYILATWPEGITTWALIATLFAIAWQSNETRRAANATEEAVVLATENAKQSLREMQLEQRAWVGVSSALIEKFAPNERVIAKMWVRNTGKTFALEATLFQRILSLYGPLKEFPETSGSEPGITLLPGAEIVAQVEGGPLPLGQDEFNAIKSGRAFIYMYGSIRYKDVMGYPHRTEFSLIYNSGTNAFQAYQGHNEAD